MVMRRGATCVTRFHYKYIVVLEPNILINSHFWSKKVGREEDTFLIDVYIISTAKQCS